MLVSHSIVLHVFLKLDLFIVIDLVFLTFSFLFRFSCVVSQVVRSSAWPVLNFLWLNTLRHISYRLAGLFLSSFMGNIIFMLTSGSHKMLKLLKEIIVHDNSFLSVFFSA